MALAAVRVVGVVGVACARLVSLCWAGQPLGAVRIDGSVALRVGARRIDATGRCGDSGELAIEAGRIEMSQGDRTVLSIPIALVEAELQTEPRPSLWLTGDGWDVVLVVDRERPVPVVVGRIGGLRQTTTAQVVVDAIREAATEVAEA